MKQLIRRNLLLLVAILIISGVTACKKKNSEPPKPVNYTAKMAGTWIGIVPDDPSDYGTSGGAFFPFTIIAVNDTTILARDTLRFVPKASTGHIYQFKGATGYYPNARSEQTIVFNSTDSSVINDYSYGGGTGYNVYGTTVHVESNSYKVNPLLKTYFAKIAGTHHLSGTYRYRGGFIDSTHTITEDVLFKTVDDFTLTYNKVFIYSMDNTLHYKYFDEVSKTITFQSYHTQPDRSRHYDAVTLVYSYQNDSIYFEQANWYETERKDVKLYN